MSSVVLDGTTGGNVRVDSAPATRSISVCNPAPPPPAADAPLPLLVRVETAVAHRSWTAARGAVLDALQAASCVVVLVGVRGSGKTLLLEELARALTAAGTPPAQHRWGGRDSERALVDGAIPSDRVLLIDEADRIEDEALGELIAYKRGGLVLARCRDLPAGVLERVGTLKRPVTVVPLAPLGAGETAAFLSARLVRAGRPADLIGPDAIARIEAWSGGVPRLVNMLASGALFLATQERTAVTAAHVDEAADMFSPHAAESAGTATDPAGLRSPESVPVARSASEPGADVPEPAAAVLARPLPVLQARRATTGRSRSAERKPQLRRAAAAAVLLVCAGAAATTWFAAHSPKTGEIASAGPAALPVQVVAPTPAAPARVEMAAALPQPAPSPTPAGELLAPTPAAPIQAEAASALPQPATTPAPAAEPVAPTPAAPARVETATVLPQPAPTPAPVGEVPAPSPAAPIRAEAASALPQPATPPAPAGEPVAPTPAPPIYAEATVPQPANSPAPVVVPSSVPEPAVRVASTDSPNGSSLAVAPQRAPTTAAPARAAASSSERVASLTLHAERALEPTNRPSAPPSRSAHVASRRVPPARSPQATEPTSSGRDQTAVASLERPAPAAPPPREPRSPVQQLVQARRALAANDSFAAREFLESAETVIAFQSSVTPERASMAAAHITDALALLNAGQPTNALPHLERAIAMVGPSS